MAAHMISLTALILLTLTGYPLRPMTGFKKNELAGMMPFMRERYEGCNRFFLGVKISVERCHTTYLKGNWRGTKWSKGEQVWGRGGKGEARYALVGLDRVVVLPDLGHLLVRRGSEVPLEVPDGAVELGAAALRRPEEPQRARIQRARRVVLGGVR